MVIKKNFFCGRSGERVTADCGRFQGVPLDAVASRL